MRRLETRNTQKVDQVDQLEERRTKQEAEDIAVCDAIKKRELGSYVETDTCHDRQEGKGGAYGFRGAVRSY